MKDSRESKETLADTPAASQCRADAPHPMPEQKNTPGASSEEDGYYRQVFMTLQVPVLLIDSETGRILECNAAAAGFYGYSAEELSRGTLWDLNALTQEELFRELLQSASRPRRLLVVRQRLYGGDIRDVELSYSPVCTGGKTVLSALARDVTKLPEKEPPPEATEIPSRGSAEGTEENLRRRIARYRSLIDSSPDVLFQTDATGLWTMLSLSWTKLTGFTPEESIGDFCLSRVHHDDRQSVALDFQALLEGKTTEVRCEMRLLRKDGSEHRVRLLAKSLRDETGRVTATGGVLQEIAAPPTGAPVPTDDRYRRLFEELNEIIFIASPEGRLLDMNRTGIETLGYSSKAELLSKSVYADIFADARDGQRFSDGLERAGSVRDFDVDVKTKAGELLTLSITAVRTSEPSLILYQGIARDVTRRRKQEQELLFAKKMEAVGQLAGGVAHDFNNILTGIRGYAEILRAKLPHESGLSAYVDRIITSSERGAHITEGLMTFSRKRKAKIERLDVDDLLENSRSLLARILGARVQVIMRTSGQKPQVMADRGQIEQVLMHLSANARDAMPQGGVFTVASEVVRLDADFKRLHGYGEPGTFVRFSVSDTGTGMDEKTRERVFEPFFTTREVGKGSGLGLSVVYGIIKQHQGYITVCSTLGQGSTFEIYLPIATVREEITRPTNFQMPQGGSETILLAEDDEVVSDLIRNILEGFGYNVISAADGEDAVAKLRENRDRVRLLISDVVMPRKTGKEIYEEVRSLRPDLRVIFISGYDEDIASGRGIFEKGFPIIPKPFSTSDLLTKVRAVLDEQPVAQP